MDANRFCILISSDYDVIAIDDILDIHKYLMEQHNKK